MALEILTDGSLFATNKLGMVNVCLLGIGEIPLVDGTVLSTLVSGTDGAIARDIVATTIIQVLAKGWFFNTDVNFPFIPDSFGFIVTPPNLLRIDSGRTDQRNIISVRGNRLYNLETQSFEFPKTIKLDAVWIVEYEDLPQQAYNYIALRAARKFQQSIVGSSDLHMFTKADEQEALMDLQREDLQYRDVNLIPERTRGFTNPKWGND